MILFFELELKLPYTNSLKEKRNILKSMLEKIKRRYNVSVIESDAQDNINRSRLSFVLISLYQNNAVSQMQEILQFIEENYEVEVIDIIKEFL